MKYARLPRLGLALFLALSAFGGLFFAPPAADAQTAYKIVGYLPSWTGSVNGAQIDLLTHVNYAFLLPNGDGSLQPIENPGKLQQLVSAAHSRGKKVLISVGGWNNGNDSAFESIAPNSTFRNNFANNLGNFITQYDLDGVDIDWEYPEAGDQYLEMMTAIRNRIGAAKLLTAAVAATDGGGAGVTASAINIMDYITLMAYDGNEGAGHSPLSLAQQSLDYWGTKTSNKAKLILGVPFYARPGWFGYNQLRAGGCSATADSCWYDNATQYYNGHPTIRSKVDLMKSKNGGGIMIWELTHDNSPTGGDSLLKTIADQLGTGTQPQPGNLAQGKPATASSIETAEFPAGLAVDGSQATRWASALSDPQWLQVDLGASYALNRVVLRWEAAYGRSYQIQVSNDASAWTTVATVTNGDGGVDDLAVSGTGRYVRMLGTQRATAWGYSLWEFEAYGAPAGGWTATASSTEPGGSAAQGVDKNTATRWSGGAAQAAGQWYRVDFGSAQSFDQVTLDAGASAGDYPRGYQLQVSGDGSAWTTVASGAGSGQVTTINVAPQTSRYIRVLLTSAVGNWWSIHELSIRKPAAAWTATASSTEPGGSAAQG
ncbi:MAG TPA: glycosyl hydrolase family 18 protein, partial [Herpetosiphonaceae bacterium]